MGEFLRIYNEAVERYVPRGGKSGVKGEEWFSGRCSKARKCKMSKWNRWRDVRTDESWRAYVVARKRDIQKEQEGRREKVWF